MDNSNVYNGKYSDLYDRVIKLAEQRQEFVNNLDKDQRASFDIWMNSIKSATTDVQFEYAYKGLMESFESGKVPRILEDLPRTPVENKQKEEIVNTVNQSDIDAGNFPKDGIYENSFEDFLNYIDEQKNAMGTEYSFLDRTQKEWIEDGFKRLRESKDVEEFKNNYEYFMRQLEMQGIRNRFKFLPTELKTYKINDDSIKIEEPEVKRDRVYDGQYNDIINAIEDKVAEKESVINERLVESKRQFLFNGLKALQDSKTDDEFIYNYNLLEKLVNNQSMGFALDYIFDDLKPDFKKDLEKKGIDNNKLNTNEGESGTSATDDEQQERGNDLNNQQTSTNTNNYKSSDDSTSSATSNDSSDNNTGNGTGDNNTGGGNDDDNTRGGIDDDNNGGGTSDGDANSGNDDNNEIGDDNDLKKGKNEKKPGLRKIIGSRIKIMSRKKKIILLCIALAALLIALNPAVQAAFITNWMLVNSWLWHILPFQAQLASMNAGFLAPHLAKLGIANSFNAATGVWTLAGLQHLSIAAPIFSLKSFLPIAATLGGTALVGMGLDKLIDKFPDIKEKFANIAAKESSPEYKKKRKELDDEKLLDEEEVKKLQGDIEQSEELNEAEKLTLIQRAKAKFGKFKENRKVKKESRKAYFDILEEYTKTIKKASTLEEFAEIYQNYKGKIETNEALTPDDKTELLADLQHDVEKAMSKKNIKMPENEVKPQDNIEEKIDVEPEKVVPITEEEKIKLVEAVEKLKEEYNLNDTIIATEMNKIRKENPDMTTEQIIESIRETLELEKQKNSGGKKM